MLDLGTAILSRVVFSECKILGTVLTVKAIFKSLHKRDTEFGTSETDLYVQHFFKYRRFEKINKLRVLALAYRGLTSSFLSFTLIWVFPGESYGDPVSDRLSC